MFVCVRRDEAVAVKVSVFIVDGGVCNRIANHDFELIIACNRIALKKQ